VSKLVGWNMEKSRRLDDIGDSMINHVRQFIKINRIITKLLIALIWNGI
jgi:hypothetical protein